MKKPFIEPQKQFSRNTRLIFLWILLILTVFLKPSDVRAATGINKQINFQGKVVNTDGTNVTDGSYSFTFKIYNSSTCPGSGALWTETKTLSTTSGIFQTLLGDTTTLPGSVDFNTDTLYLSITYNGDPEMCPMVRLAAVPYAFNANTVGGITFSGTSDNTYTLPSTSGGTILTSNAPTQSIPSTQASGTVLGLTDSTAITAAIVGQSITLSGPGSFDQTGLQFNLSGATGTNLSVIVGTGSS